MLAKFETFSKAKQRALFTVEDINSVEKLQKYISSDRQKSRKCKPMLHLPIPFTRPGRQKWKKKYKLDRLYNLK